MQSMWRDFDVFKESYKRYFFHKKKLSLDKTVSVNLIITHLNLYVIELN